MSAKSEYYKNRRRIQSAINRLKKEGYLITDDILPAIPKRITLASVRRLERITTKSITEKAKALNIETGEIISVKKARKEISQAKSQARQRRKEYGGASRPNVLPNYDDIVIRNFEREMTLIFGRNEKLFNYIQRWFNRSLMMYGKPDFAKALTESYQEGEWPSWEAVSDEELLVGSLRGIIDRVGGSIGAREEIMEELEMGEEWADY